MALDIRVGDILNEKENTTEDNFQAEAQVAVDEEQENSFIAQNESKAVSLVKQLAEKETDEDVTEHPMMVWSYHEKLYSSLSRIVKRRLRKWGFPSIICSYLLEWI